jgi:hypothetical protein
MTIATAAKAISKRRLSADWQYLTQLFMVLFSFGKTNCLVDEDKKN